MVLVSNIDGAELPDTTKNLDETLANNQVYELVKKFPERLRGLAWTRPRDGSAHLVEKFLKDCLDSKRQHAFVGLKFHPEFNRFAADDPRIDRYLQLAEKYHVPAVFHCGSPNSLSSPQRIYRAARRHPRVAIVLYHMGFGTNHEDAIGTVKQSIDKGDAQLYLETAQAEPSAVLKAIKAIGSKRVMFGTDATYFGKEHYSNYEALVTLLGKQLTQPELSDVMRGNAVRLFKLSMPAP